MKQGGEEVTEDGWLMMSIHKLKKRREQKPVTREPDGDS